VTVTDANQSWSSGLCSGSGNFWLGIIAPDGKSYYSNQTVLGTSSTPPPASGVVLRKITPNQVAPFDSRFPKQFRLSVTYDGAPDVGTTVTFHLIRGGRQVSHARVTTNGSGIAASGVVQTGNIGTERLTATVPGGNTVTWHLRIVVED
jgi:hypothetical protein